MKYRLFLTELKKGGPSDPIYLSTPTSELPLQCAGDPLGMHLVKRQRYEHMSELLAPYTFNKAIQALQRDAPQVEEYVSSISYENFTFTRFPRPRFGHNISNIVKI
jgi:hypothetical protein